MFLCWPQMSNFGSKQCLWIARKPTSLGLTLTSWPPGPAWPLGSIHRTHRESRRLKARQEIRGNRLSLGLSIGTVDPETRARGFTHRDDPANSSPPRSLRPGSGLDSDLPDLTAAGTEPFSVHDCNTSECFKHPTWSRAKGLILKLFPWSAKQ